MIHEFHIYKFANSLKFICEMKISTCGTFMVSGRAAKNFSLLTCMFPAKAGKGYTLPSCFSSHTVYVSFSQSIDCYIFHIFAFC